MTCSELRKVVYLAYQRKILLLEENLTKFKLSPPQWGRQWGKLPEKKERVKLTNKNNFMADIIKEVGKIQYSNTQEIRVLLVRDPENGVKVSCQKWWRTSTEEDWNVGKGFFLNGRDSFELGKMLQEIGEEIIHIKN